MTDDAMVQLFEAKFEHLEEKLDDIDEKVTRIDGAIFGNGTDGLKVAVAVNSEFIRYIRDSQVLTKVTDNTTFRLDAKKLIFKILAAAILSGGAAAGAVQGIAKLFG